MGRDSVIGFRNMITLDMTLKLDEEDKSEGSKEEDGLVLELDIDRFDTHK